ncbi:MAG: hypothetical protein ACD_15C00112G0001 [uncultured bacterium]|nr:MAG: hypothetical protein ACD_15C00112G0001 [uncultured bacterium]HCU70659.1 hypothetical protein [Candidatus Moranbacteria bacterium]
MKHLNILLCIIFLIPVALFICEHIENMQLKKHIDTHKEEIMALRIKSTEDEVTKAELMISNINTQIKSLELVALIDPPNILNALEQIEKAKAQKQKLEQFKNEKMNMLAAIAKGNSS